MIVQDILRQLSGFARSRVTLNDDDGIVLDDRENLFSLSKDRQSLILIVPLFDLSVIVQGFQGVRNTEQLPNFFLVRFTGDSIGIRLSFDVGHVFTFSLLVQSQASQTIPFRPFVDDTACQSVTRRTADRRAFVDFSTDTSVPTLNKRISGQFSADLDRHSSLDVDTSHIEVSLRSSTRTVSTLPGEIHYRIVADNHEYTLADR